MTPGEYLKRPYSRVVVPEADGTFRCEILEFPGCIAVGDTAVEALTNLENVAESWLESVLARGQAVPSPFEDNDYSGKTVLRLAKSMHQKAAIAARRDGVSLNTFLVNCVAEQLGVRKASITYHYTTNLSQQNNVVFLDYNKAYTTTTTSTHTAELSGQASSTGNVPVSNQNPWGR